MVMDWQAAGVGAGAIITAVGAVIAGIFTGRNSRKKDESEAAIRLQDARFARENAEEVASRERIQAIAADAERARVRIRDLEAEMDRRSTILRGESDRGWNLARYYFNMATFTIHLLNNIFQVGLTDASTPERIAEMIKNSKTRMDRDIKIPGSFEEPFPPTRKQE